LSARRYYRHTLAVRLFHWVNALGVILLLMSGLQIFNSYPRLHWGNLGNPLTPAIVSFGGNKDAVHPQSWMSVGEYRIATTGVLGSVQPTTFYGVTNITFPGWMTLPSGPMDLGGGRAWHFLMIWVFFLNFAWFLGYGLVAGYFRRRYIPERDQLTPRAVLSDLRRHLMFRRATDEESVRFNLLQKLSYLTVVFVLMPAMVLTGMTMSPSALAAFPWLLDLFQGRQTARTLHFVFALLLVVFLLVHVLQVFVAGFVNEMRSMITGYFDVPERNEK
jgi:thiosulfate reductase cytochrome b subunit